MPIVIPVTKHLVYVRISKDLSMNSIDCEVTLDFDRKKERVWHVSLVTRSGSVHMLCDKLIVRVYKSI